MYNNDLVSLNELAKILGINKSKLTYYVSLGIVIPSTTVGKMQIFNKKEVLTRIKKIKKLQEEGKTLFQIKNQIK